MGRIRNVHGLNGRNVVEKVQDDDVEVENVLQEGEVDDTLLLDY